MSPSQGRNPRILVVDNDRDQRELIREALEVYYDDPIRSELVAVGSAQQCLEQNLESFDVILVEDHLPDMGGLALLEQILARADIPVVFVTSENNSAKAVEAIECGAQDYIVKLGDYLFALPAVIRKSIAQHRIRVEKEILQQKLEATCEELRIKNFQLEESLDRLQEMAETDPLTHLANRRSFAESLTRSFSEAMRYGFDMSCCMCDLDHYKQLNDTLGHQVGDEVLALAANVIQQELRTSDIAARYGGDEMVLLLPHTCLQRASSVAQRIREQLALRSASHPRLNHEVTMSIGIASLETDHPTSADALVSMADRALYIAKSLGKDRIVTFSRTQETLQ
jgi:diguanylate cyclase (GGDEF)-like protein